MVVWRYGRGELTILQIKTRLWCIGRIIGQESQEMREMQQENQMKIVHTVATLIEQLQTGRHILEKQGVGRFIAQGMVQELAILLFA